MAPYVPPHLHAQWSAPRAVLVAMWIRFPSSSSVSSAVLLYARKPMDAMNRSLPSLCKVRTLVTVVAQIAKCSDPRARASAAAELFRTDSFDVLVLVLRSLTREALHLPTADVELAGTAGEPEPPRTGRLAAGRLPTAVNQRNGPGSARLSQSSGRWRCWG